MSRRVVCGSRFDVAGIRIGRRLPITAVLVLTGIALVGCSGDTPPPQPPSPAAEAPSPPPPPVEKREEQAVVLARGLELFSHHCSSCHGDKGTGEGTAAYLLYPKPRDFSSGTFLLTSTEMGLPSNEDLLKTLGSGMPGSAMPPWSHLPKEDLDALVLAIRHLALEGTVAELTEDGSLPREEALEIGHEMLDSGPKVELPAIPSDVDLALGKKVYIETCAKCHDEDGRGQLKEDMVDESGYPSFARDFTAGVFKGGSDDEAVAMRLVRGLPGSPMPGTEYTPEELWALVRYVQTMIEPGAQARIEQRQQTLTAKRVEGPAPSEPTDVAWKDAPKTYLAVMPLWWRHDRVEGVNVQAIHNGTKLVLRLTWDDVTGNDHQLGQRAFSDGVAVQFSESADPPLFAMGTEDEVVSLWYWRAAGQRAMSDEALALKDIYPNMPHTDEDAYPGIPRDPIYTTALGAGNPVSSNDSTTAAEDLSASGFGTLTNRGHSAQDVHGSGSRDGSSWQVVLARELDSGREGEVSFQPGQTVQVAFAVWEGASGDRNGQKSVTIWHRLSLDQ